MSEPREQIADSLIADAFGIIDSKYGENSGNFLPYHGVEHARDVIGAAERLYRDIVEVEYIPTELSVVRIAAAYHDVEQGLGRIENERESARIAVDKMFELDQFTAAELEITKEMIMATVTTVDERGLSQSPGDRIESKILADADLAVFGSPAEVYWSRMEKLLIEFQAVNPGISLRDFVVNEIKILGNHEYHTDSAIKIFNSIEDNLLFLQNMLADLEASQ